MVSNHCVGRMVLAPHIYPLALTSLCRLYRSAAVTFQGAVKDIAERGWGLVAMGGDSLFTKGGVALAGL